MDSSQKDMMDIVASSFYAELRAVVDKHRVHGAWFAWVQEGPSETPEGNRVGKAAVLCAGCAHCATTALAVSVLSLDSELREVFQETLSELSRGQVEAHKFSLDPRPPVH